LLTLIVTPSMLMVFTRANRKSDQRSLLARLFGRTAKSEEAASPDQPTQAVPEIACPKAAE
jgi:multidrug efflux pump